MCVCAYLSFSLDLSRPLLVVKSRRTFTRLALPSTQTGGTPGQAIREGFRRARAAKREPQFVTSHLSVFFSPDMRTTHAFMPSLTPSLLHAFTPPLLHAFLPLPLPPFRPQSDLSEAIKLEHPRLVLRQLHAGSGKPPLSYRCDPC